MKKIYYAITRIGRKENIKFTGVGYINDEDLFAACIGKDNTPYVRIFQDIVKYCHPVVNTPNQFKGAYSETQEVEFTDKNGAKSTREVELDYLVWYKLAE